MSKSTFTEKPEVNKHNWFKMHSDKHMIRCALFSDLALSGLELLNAFPDDGWVCVIHNTTRLRWRHNEQLLQAIHGKHLPLNRSFSDTNTSKKWHFLNMTFKWITIRKITVICFHHFHKSFMRGSACGKRWSYLLINNYYHPHAITLSLSRVASCLLISWLILLNKCLYSSQYINLHIYIKNI